MQSSREKFELERCKGFPGGASAKEPACQCRIHKRHRFNPWVGKLPWRRAWHPTPVPLPGKSHGQRSLVGYSPQGHKELDTDMDRGKWNISCIFLVDKFFVFFSPQVTDIFWYFVLGRKWEKKRTFIFYYFVWKVSFVWSVSCPRPKEELCHCFLEPAMNDTFILTFCVTHLQNVFLLLSYYISGKYKLIVFLNKIR